MLDIALSESGQLPDGPVSGCHTVVCDLCDTKFSKAVPCTIFPAHFLLCPTSVSRQPQTIWKYNAMYHLIQEHSIGDTSPPIPEGRTIFLTMMVLRFIYKALKLIKGTDLTLYPQLILTSLMEKDIN